MTASAGNREPELRFGLVLYGGVSLAVYIYGVVVEVQRLLRASAEKGRGEEAGAYAEALAAAGVSRATVDVIAGTSAGGINGILLAKALAAGADVESVRDLWIEGGDIAELMHRLDDDEPKSLLRRDIFESRLTAGFDRLGEQAWPPDPDGVLDLFVSSTHLRGNRRLFMDALGRDIPTLLHRYVFRLKLRRRYGRDDFAPRQNPGQPPGAAADNARLVKLARATSAFPVAFEPVRIDEPDGLLGPHDEPSGWFADGGILNNKPFTEALEAIFTRSSDRSVRRWLLSVDPDPGAIPVGPAPGPEPGFDQIAARAMVGIPRYQSIAHDLEALEEHNAAVRRVTATMLDLEEGLIGGGEPPGRYPRRWGRATGFSDSAAYENLRARAWAEEIADQLMLAVRFAPPEGVDLAAIHAAFTAAALARILARGNERDSDLSYERRRAYYLIKLLGAAVGESSESADLDSLRAALWGAFEEVSDALWDLLAREPLALGEGKDESGEARLSQLAFAAAERRLADALEALAERRGPIAEAVESAIAGISIYLPRSASGGDGARPAFEVDLRDVFRGFPHRDAVLLPIEAGGGLRRRDLVNHAQISPLTATNTGVNPAKKLAGDTAGHFGGFLDGGWRENDLLWGRLDAAEVLIGAILGEATPDERKAAITAAQVEVLAAEMPDALDAPDGDWRAYLREHAIGSAKVTDLPPKRLAGLAARAGLVLRGMVRTAGEEAPDGGFRARALRATTRTVDVGARLLFLPLLVLRRLARRTEPRD